MKNLLERAATYKSQKRAVKLVADALRIELPVTTYRFCNQARWVNMHECSRLMEIEAWMVCEFRRAMKLVPALDPMKTVGTND